MMNLKQKIFLRGLSNVFCYLAMRIGVLASFINSNFKFYRDSKKDSFLKKDGGFFFFSIENIFFQQINGLFSSLFRLISIHRLSQISHDKSSRNWFFVFFTAFLFSSQLNAQDGIYISEDKLYITEGTVIFGEDNFYFADKPDVSKSSQKLIAKKRVSKNVVKEAVEKQEKALQIPKGGFDDIVYHTDSNSASAFLSSSFIKSNCAIVCTNFIYKFVGENTISFNETFLPISFQVKNSKTKISDRTRFFLSELFSHQFFGTSPPLTIV